ncbi:uncharacterized protein PpBr36_10030 [Pyricularia pennisetigena]|uniref:uncharacterized protein n=1 Tax=Pyricularia pennisetigena TaxID=1578925 RepID=UPI001154EAD0|nr:uncharacterized protein PpBr36_10030 [Pyricularia pennisetigena]TLS22198.1 hypothetical protein PpBr36_10030 [Pyricularia pennisetigena]
MSSPRLPENLQPADSPFTFHPSLARDPDLAAQFLQSDFAARDRVMAHKHARNSVLAALAASFPPRDPIPDRHAGLETPEKGSLAATVRDVLRLSAEEGAREKEDSLVDENKTRQPSPSGWVKSSVPSPPAAVRGGVWNVGDCVPADAKSGIRALGRRQ